MQRQMVPSERLMDCVNDESIPSHGKSSHSKQYAQMLTQKSKTELIFHREIIERLVLKEKVAKSGHEGKQQKSREKLRRLEKDCPPPPPPPPHKTSESPTPPLFLLLPPQPTPQADKQASRHTGRQI